MYDPDADPRVSVEAMLYWRRVFGRAYAVVAVGLCVALACGAIPIRPLAGLIDRLDATNLGLWIAISALAALVALAIPVIVSLAQVAYTHRGMRYAVFHTWLALTLTPVVFVGVLFVPDLVVGDIRRCQAAAVCVPE